MAYERLTKRLPDGSVEYESDGCIKVLYPEDANRYDEGERMILRLAELEDKIESGQAVILQAKIGDWVYGFSKDLQRVIFGKVYRTNLDIHGEVYYTVYENDETTHWLYFVYKTEDEAKAKMKELRRKE